LPLTGFFSSISSFSVVFCWSQFFEITRSPGVILRSRLVFSSFFPPFKYTLYPAPPPPFGALSGPLPPPPSPSPRCGFSPIVPGYLNGGFFTRKVLSLKNLLIVPPWYRYPRSTTLPQFSPGSRDCFNGTPPPPIQGQQDLVSPSPSMKSFTSFFFCGIFFFWGGALTLLDGTTPIPYSLCY